MIALVSGFPPPRALARRFFSRGWVQAGAWVLFFLALPFSHAAEVIPPTPPNHFNDFAGVVRRETAQKLNSQLADFERETSNQLVVAIYPKLESNSSVDDYAVRVAQRWAVGRKDKKNGAVLFMFQQSRDIRIVTGYGLEAVLPDALCKQIIENEMVPRFRAGDFDAGLTAGVQAMIAATRGEYKGTGRTVADARGGSNSGSNVGGIIIFIILILLFSRGTRRRGGMLYGGRGRTMMGGTPWIGGGSSWGGGSSGGGSSGGGGSFSGGGGSFGGGGAGGKW